MSTVNLEDPSFIQFLVKPKVLSYTVKDGCAAGDNVAGSLKSIAVSTEEGKTVHLIIKFITENTPFWVTTWKSFHIENAMYAHVAPLLSQFSSKHGYQYTPSLPKYIAGSIEEKHEYLCLEDVRPIGFRMPDKRKSLSFQEMSLVLKELAKFHAVSYALLQQEGNKIFENDETSILRFNIDEKYKQSDAYVCLYFQETVKLWEERAPLLARHMSKLLPIHESLKRSIRTNKQYFQTLIHHDLWANNLMIKYSDTGEPEKVIFLDFQFVQEGNVFEDLLYLFFTSTTPDYRTHHAKSSLLLYFEEFERTLGALNCPMPERFTEEFLYNEFKKCYPAAFVRMTFAVALQLGDMSPVENQPEQPDVATRVRNYYTRSPIALERIDALVMELISCGFI